MLSRWVLGFKTEGFAAMFGLGIGVPLLAALVWGRFWHARISSIAELGHLVLEFVMFGLGAAALYAADILRSQGFSRSSW